MEFTAKQPVKGQSFRTYFRIVNENDTGKNFSEITVLFPAVSIDDQSFNNTVNSAIAVPTGTVGRHEGWYYIDLTSDETNGDVIKLSVHSGGSGGRQVVSQTFYTISTTVSVEKSFIRIPGFAFQKNQVIAIQFTDADRKVYVLSKDAYKMAQVLPQIDYDNVKTVLTTVPEYLKIANFLFNKNRLRGIQFTDATRNVYVTGDDAYKMGIPVPTQEEYDAIKALVDSLSI